jgi:hypothetical protein
MTSPSSRGPANSRDLEDFDTAHGKLLARLAANVAPERATLTSGDGGVAWSCACGRHRGSPQTILGGDGAAGFDRG